MAKKGRVQVKLRSSESAYMYVTTKNPKKHPERMVADPRDLVRGRTTPRDVEFV